jgi:hypothetical protein
MEYLIDGSGCIVTKTCRIQVKLRPPFAYLKTHSYGAFCLKSTMLVRTNPPPKNHVPLRFPYGTMLE